MGGPDYLRPPRNSFYKRSVIPCFANPCITVIATGGQQESLIVYMKTTSRSVHKIVLAALAALFVLGGASNLWADNVYVYDSRHDYRHDHYGYWDEHNHYRHFIYWHEHYGYWDDRGPVRVFINCD
jgi:hypothetical protein